MAVDLPFALAIYERLLMESKSDDILKRQEFGVEPTDSEYAMLDRLWQISVMRSIELPRRCT